MKQVKLCALFVFLFLTATDLVAQSTPESFSYQAVVRDANGRPISEQNVGLRFHILRASANGPLQYSETQTATTNEAGLITLEVGGGNTIAGNFSQINWATGPFFIRVEIDPTGGTNYSLTTTNQLLSVPYALHAKVAESVLGGQVIEIDPHFDASPASEISSDDIDRLATYDANVVRIDVLENNLTTEVTRATNAEQGLATDITTEETARIAGDNANATDISTNATNITTNATDIANEITRATNAETVIATDLATEVTARIAGDAANATAIASNSTDIATNTTNITANTTAIATNTADITTNADNLAAEITRATNAETVIADNLTAEEAARIAGDNANATAIATNATDIATNTTNITANATAIADNTADITTNADNLAAEITRATNAETANATAITALETLANGNIYLGNGSNEATEVALTGDVTMDNTGATTISNDAVTTVKILDANVTDAKIATEVDATKLADGTVSNTELQYINSLTSNAQTQLNDKAPIAFPIFTGTVTAPTLVSGDVTYPNTDGTAGQVITTNGSGALSWAATGVPNGTTPGEMQYWNGTNWVVVAPASSNGRTLYYINNVPQWGPIVGPTDVMSTTGKIWMDRNLGASQVATSSADADSYGDLYQWGRGTDGHQLRGSGTIGSQSDTPGDQFIIGFTDWRSTQNDNLWQGVNGVNNPCPSGYRLPTESEFNAERTSWSSSNAAGAFASPLKFPVAGYRGSGTGDPADVNVNGTYWSSTVSDANSIISLVFGAGSVGENPNARANGFSVRCLKD